MSAELVVYVGREQSAFRYKAEIANLKAALENKEKAMVANDKTGDLERLKKACNNCTYLGYTATSQAIFLAHDNSFLRPDFYAVLDPGIGYVGNHELFGEANQILNTNQKIIV